MIQILEDRKVKVQPIIRKRAFYKPGHDGEFMFTGCFRDYCLPYDSKKRSYVNPFKSQEEQDVFEAALSRPKGALNLYNFKSPFWGKEFKISIDKKGMDLNLNNPADALWYRVFKVDPKFANSEEEITPETQYVLIDAQESQEKVSRSALKKSRAFEILSKLKKSKTKMIDTLRLLNKKPSETATMEWLEAELVNVIEEAASATKNRMTGIDKFLEVVEDPKAAEKIFVMDAIDAGEIKLVVNGYRITENDKYLGKTLIDAVDYFSSNDPEAKERKLIIKERIGK